MKASQPHSEQLAVGTIMRCGHLDQELPEHFQVLLFELTDETGDNSGG